ncbi:NIPSNAP family protein [Flavobacterium urumqiense]|uniref:NIPSNAP protein n=1 Tax=Flavobacterium urumqiense TaxID=935224 RepID=A0A1H6A434_9FLAO|nr:NIPSNAP family protein [Flavobacterium urumqiense]SEG42835.1 NIPSNAP protein [Flavobacterium urumqiense]
MKATKLLFLMIIASAITSFTIVTADSKIVVQSREFYQLKTYVLNSEQQVQTTDKYLKEAYLPALKKLGIKNIGVFKLKPNATDTLKKIIVLIPFKSLSQFLALEEKLAKDKTYLATGAQYLNATYKQAPYSRIESVLLKAFADHPILTIPVLNSPRANRVYELRSYESATEAIYSNKVDMFKAGGEIKLFDRLAFNPAFYGEVISGAKMPNLMYMTTFANQESRDAHWKAFSDSPEWKELIALEKYKNNISHMDITFLYPTDYSDY